MTLYLSCPLVRALHVASYLPGWTCCCRKLSSRLSLPQGERGAACGASFQRAGHVWGDGGCTLCFTQGITQARLGHLGDFEPLSEIPCKSARAQATLPCWEGGKLHHKFDLLVGSQPGFAGDSEEDSSSIEEAESGHPWHPGASLPDTQDPGDSDSDMFEPEGIYHPRSWEWRPDGKVEDYVARKIRQLLDKEVQARLKAECPRPTLPDKVAATPEIDPKMCTFFAKYMRDPKKGIDQS
ncbi:hypothetical protein NDU88_003810 [Pleurodeles waltl]|uniref:Uncharacterized protein n=1 Tax=Pleurodeles waltl TaxID=8319 RepID=A0AAV7M9V7_PLEWA|nr:hypothetical protein NDU88_003810 [Pleurodeles waltl]